MTTLSDHDRAQIEADQRRAGTADLFSQPPAQRHSPTSIEAAHSVKPSTGALRGKVLDAIREHGPLTDEQISRITGIAPNTARPRRVELMDAGMIVAVGKTKTRSGRFAVAWGIPR